MKRIILLLMYKLLHLCIVPISLFLLVYSCTNKDENLKSNFWGIYFIIFSIVIIALLLKLKQLIFILICEYIRKDFDKTDLVLSKTIDYKNGFYYKFRNPDKSENSSFVISCDYNEMSIMFKFDCYYLDYFKKKKYWWIKSSSELNKPMKISLFFHSSSKNIINYVLKKEKQISSNHI
ncbi:hypothetical protein [Aquirufa aurantiipilula]|uniref:hypothetical protein n=1 Tax=Aquirufa aurantiipilula TaxID=2696561 RepID=UPI0023EB8AF0|nr:hypothetical protein [Aquirufa aurantiipilula]